MLDSHPIAIERLTKPMFNTNTLRSTVASATTWWRRRQALKNQQRRLNLALQGGGAHGAFTWGVLDALLEEATLDFDAISGSSAGAINAVVMTHGWLAQGRQGAKQALHEFWSDMGKQIPSSMIAKGDGDAIRLTSTTKLLASLVDDNYLGRLTTSMLAG